MGMMVIGADRSSFAIPAHANDASDFFDTLYCLTPQDLDRLPQHNQTVLTAAAVLLAAAQEFVVEGLAELFPFWRQPVSDQVALAVLAFAAIGVERACLPDLPARPRFDAVNGGLELICDFAGAISGTDHRPELTRYAQTFDAARRTGDPEELARLMRCALVDLLVDQAHQRQHGMRISLLVRGAVERLQRELIPAAGERLVACWPNGATNCDTLVARLTNTSDALAR